MELNRYGGRLCFVHIASIRLVFLHMVLLKGLPVAAHVFSCFSAVVRAGCSEEKTSEAFK